MNEVEMFANAWLATRANLTKAQKALVIEFAREIDKMMEVEDEKS